MKNTSSGMILKYFTVVVFTAIFLSIAACKKEGTKTEDPPKTLTKSLIYDKKWWNSGGTITHLFNSNGKYGISTSTWAWLNNSDSMEINYSGGSREVWYFEWSTEHEFSAKPSKNSGYILFKDQIW